MVEPHAVDRTPGFSKAHRIQHCRMFISRAHEHAAGRCQVSLIYGPKSAFAACIGVVLVACSSMAGCSDNDASRQSEVARKGAAVMPFDLDKTHHTFEQNPGGGVETVRANDPADSAQIALVRSHLESESVKFANGDFSDPMAIHGMAMPGVSQLSSAGSRLQVKYAELPDGASITYASDDSIVISAIHDWFVAQVSDHGAHASSH